MLKKIAIILLFLISVYGIYFYFYPQSFDNTPSTKEDFLKALANAKDVYIIMDLNNGYKQGVMNCGVGIAGSEGLAGKNKHIFAFEGNVCVRTDKNTSINECIRDAKNGVIFEIVGGNETKYYKNRLKIGVMETNPVCKVSFVS